MPTMRLFFLLVWFSLTAVPLVSHAHIVGQEADAPKPDDRTEEEAVEVIDIDELLKRIDTQRGDIREQQGSTAKQYPENNRRLAPLVQRVLDDELTTDEQRTQMRIFHGQWDALSDVDELALDQRAQLALLRYDLEHPSLQDKKADPLLQAQAALLRGEPEQTLDLLTGVKGIRAAALRGRAFEDLGQLPEAVRAYTLVKEFIEAEGRIERDPAVVNAAAQAVSDLARLEGRPRSTTR